MRFLLRPANLFLLLTYLALSAVPFVPMLLGKPLDRPFQVLGVEFVGWVAAWAVFKRPAWFHWLLIPAFLALPTEVYLFTYYGQGISTHHLGIIAETSPKEAMEFLGQKVWAMLAVMVGVVAWWITSYHAARKTRELDWTDSSRWVTLAALATGAAVWAYGYEFGVAAKPVALAAAAPARASKAAAIHLVNASVPVAAKASVAGSASEEEEEEDDDEEDASASAAAAGHTGLTLPPLARWAKLPFEFDAFAQSWPFGLAARGVDFYKERKYLAELGQRSASFKFGAHQQAPDGQPETVVLVLGESSRYDRWSLNGYARDTNPLLRQEANLVTLPDVITAVSATRLSVPVIISRKTAMQSLKDGFSEKSFITAYKEAGFKTFWLSNQISFGQFDTPVSVFAREADVIEFLNLGGFTNNSNFDQVLFDPFKNALADRAPKKLIVVHSLGSHWNYSHRYPKQFDKWQPSLYGIDKPVYTDTKIKPLLNNSYDSSILYTDWFLAQLIERLKQSEQRSSMLYVSDHGQTLYDKTCNLAFHGHNTQYEFHIPAFVWYSDQYRARYPGKVEQLGHHSRARLATENMFHTLLDLGDIRYASEKLEWSFLNSQFRQHKRYVDSYGWTNYDNATLKGDCHEVIDKDKPLKQEK
jgi:glucan phosphoethanolaminetransferase (alkaline phosphatase superfamily)